MSSLWNWIRSKFSSVDDDSPLPPDAVRMNQSGQHRAASRPRPEQPPSNEDESFDTVAGGKIESLGPGKNVLVRKFVREDTGTHETLKILDENAISADDDGGIDPYNTGSFDRSKNWDKRRK